MNFIFNVYIFFEVIFLVTAIIIYYISNGEDRLVIPNTIHDRTWWKYTKLSTYYILFWISHVPWWISESSKFRSLFKKD